MTDHPQESNGEARRDKRRTPPTTTPPVIGSAIPIIPPPEKPWPAPLDESAYIGPLGEYARFVEPHTEADPAAILLQSLVMFGSVIGRSAFFNISDTRHHTNIFVVIVGGTNSGKKGTACRNAITLFRDLDPEWDNRCDGGLASGEGILEAVRDTRGEDPGEPDKRLLAIESEFARTLRQFDRNGNTLSAMLRQAWDDGRLQKLTVNPIRATGAHVSAIGHITPEELLTLLTANDASNGLGNRFLWMLVRRSKILPDPQPLPAARLRELRNALADAIEHGKNAGEVFRTSAATALWTELYSTLDDDRPGIVGKLTARLHVHLMRLALIYAVSMKASHIDVIHIEAATAVVEYCLRSVEHIFGDRDADKDTSDLLQFILDNPQGISRADIGIFFSGHMRATVLTDKLNDLARRGLIRGEKQTGTGGKPREMWYPILNTEKGK